MTGPATQTGPTASFPDRVDPSVPCPSCHGRGLRLFYEVLDVPVHSCLLVPSRREALDYPTGSLRLGFCDACGFVTNTAFDPADNRYSTEYEETQGFSPTFSAFARSLAEDLASRHDLDGRTVLEIGCGKGEFLALLCQVSGCLGIGIDPGCRPERLPTDARDRIEVIQELYDARFAHLDADLVVCRHTLEHIGPVGRFLRDIRTTLDESPGVPVFFELPDVKRVLHEGAFWDLYYEHCSYFSAGSLARLFRSSSFEVTALEVAYGDQYLLIEGMPAAAPTAARLPLEDDLRDLRSGLDAFRARGSATIRHWQRLLERRAGEGKRVVLWGSGSKAVSFLTTLRPGSRVDAVVDINPYRQGHFMPATGHEIIGPQTLLERPPDCVIVMNPVYVPEIRATLAGLGLDPEIVAL